jgi:hypothetical protein
MNWIKKNNDLIFTIFVLLFFISDIFTNVILKLNFDFFSRFSGAVKLVIEFIMLLIIIINYKQIHKSYLTLLAIILLFVISQIYFQNNDYHSIKDSILYNNIYYFNRYIYILIFIVYSKTLTIQKETFLRIFKYFEYILIVNSIFIILGFLTGINFFKSFSSIGRFGYMGLFSKSGETSFFYMVAIVTSYFLWIKTKDSIKLYKTNPFSG